ncbi:asparaginase domain-containing protein [Moraxella cuniculi]|uniref:L-asparaginase 1 n=1 Tax=Moraxella cuniculi TaxID=34061 RepID=A0A3S4QQH9_9GAMM|nr:asparaginase domain-containing protein [Moraxella cuniculi]VEG13691.1 L-asparaginase 1 [Moraxella cuniculi]
MTNLNCCLIYAGGTFGSHGVPLSPLPATVFLPILHNQLSQHGYHVQILDNRIIKDSSTLTASDFVAFYQLILHAYQQGQRRFVLITGTDTLSFLAAFLANALADFSDISLVITGSMQPLLIATSPDYQTDTASDAWANLSEAIDLAMTHFGVFVQFCYHSFDARNTQKIDSQSDNAFIGATAQFGQTRTHSTTIDESLAKLPMLIQQADNTVIEAIYALPNNPDILANALAGIHRHTRAVILIGFGAGNLPQSESLIAAITKLQQQGIAIISTTMCAYGGVNDNYAAGAWQYQHGVWSAGTLGVAGIYGKALWLALNNQLTQAQWVQS